MKLFAEVWDIAKEQICHVFEGHEQEVYAIVFSADGHRIVSGSGDGIVRIWDMESGASTVLTITA